MKRGMLLGIAIGDAVGVPYEFKDRGLMKTAKAKDMVGYGTHNQPVGTWSDDTSLALCLAENIGEGLDLEKLADKFVNWRYHGYMVAGEKIFDIGLTTTKSISNLLNRTVLKLKPEECGLSDNSSNGNGSVMRILPLAWYFHNNKDLYPTHKERFELVSKVSSLTHGHFISCMAAHILVEFALEIINYPDQNKHNILIMSQRKYREFIKDCDSEHLDEFKRVLAWGNIWKISEDEIYSTGYAVSTLEAAIWCFMNTTDYESCVLKAVNLGYDTDTTAAVAGGLAGLYYGEDKIPKKWKNKILKRDLIEELEIKMIENGNNN